MIVRSLTSNIEKGFYVEIGAHHPVYISNTHHFYSKGWRGINIDAIPDSMRTFKVLRPRDINLEICIVPPDYPKEVTFFMFEAAAFNTCDLQSAEQTIAKGIKLLEQVKIPTKTLTEVFDIHLPAGTQIDFMSIDIEGLDEQVLMSNDWSRYQPNILVFEKHSVDIQDFSSLEIVKYLAKIGYQLVAKTGCSWILQRQK
jgi:Methyltransferase FkbM domain